MFESESWYITNDNKILNKASRIFVTSHDKRHCHVTRNKVLHNCSYLSALHRALVLNIINKQKTLKSKTIKKAYKQTQPKQNKKPQKVVRNTTASLLHYSSNPNIHDVNALHHFQENGPSTVVEIYLTIQ